jgi:cystathionine beta-lyase/cystathionine gamma-synthase
MTHASIPAATLDRMEIDESLIRASVGLEDCSDLVADLAQALEFA